MAVTDKYVDELRALPWNGNICPHGVEHLDHQMYFQFCNACLEYAMQAEGETL